MDNKTGYSNNFSIMSNQLGPASRCKIAIVGGGIAGLSAAKALLECKCKDILLIEAQEKLGGRIDTIKYNNGYLDIGAQWLHSSKNELYKLSNKHNLLSNKEINEGKGLYVREDGFCFDNFIVEKVNFIIGQILKECEDFSDAKNHPKSIGNYLNEKFLEYLKDKQLSEYLYRQYMELFDWNVRFQIIDNSCDNLYQLSAKYWGEYGLENEDTQNHISYKNGIGSVIEVLSDFIPKDKIMTSSPVININWENDPIQIILDNNTIIEADGVIVTCSLGVLKHLEELFTPSLPKRIIQTIDNMGYGGICKIFLEFSEKWWKDEGYQIIWNWDRSYGDDWMRYISGFDLVHGQRCMLIGWVGGKGAELVEKIPENTIGKNCTTLLRKFLKRNDVPYPIKVIRTKWNTNPWIRGAYCHTTPSCDADELGPRDLRTPITDKQNRIKVVLAGEACSSEHFSTIHGAYESGQQQAMVLFNSLH